MTWSLQLLVDGVDYFDDAASIRAGRGVKISGVLDQLDPGELTAVLQGAGYFPAANTHVRPGRSTVLQLSDGVTTHDIFTGRNDDLGLHPAKTATALPAVELICLDLVADLAQVKTFTSTGGSLTQRVDAALVDAALSYVVHDPDAPGATPALVTDAKGALDQLRRVLDTAHAIAYADGSNVLQIYADALRPAGPALMTLTDGTAPGDVDYVDLDRDSSASKGVVNDLTLTRLDTATTETYVDDLSADTYGHRTQAVTVLEGTLEDHAWRFLSLRWPPVDTIRSVTINATLSDIWPTVAQLNPYDLVDVVTDGITVPSRVLYVEHTITPRKGLPPKWLVTLDLARVVRSPITWDQVPATVTWDTVPAQVTWNSAATWHPEDT